MTWEAIRSLANVGAFFVALAALLVSWAVYRRSNSAELRSAINTGDAALGDRLDLIEATVQQGHRGIEQRITRVETTIEQGIQRKDIEALHNRISYLVEKVGGLDAKMEGVGKHLDRVDTFLRKN